MTKVGLGLLLSREGHKLSSDDSFQIHLTDTLDSPREELFPKERGEASEIKLQRGRHADGFDFVVGNPPYGKVPSTDPRVQNFKETIYGHANMYGMFLQFALERLSAKGRLGFIVPKSFASGLYFKRLRRFMLDRIHLDEVLTFNSRTDVFRHSNVLQETVVMMGSRGTNRATVVLKEAQDHLSLASPPDRVEVPLSEVDLGRDFEHVLCISAKEQKRRIEACYVPATWRPHPEGFFLENHLNFIFKKDPGCSYDLACLSALLNSKLLDFVFRVFNGNTQVSATELNILPLPLELPGKFKALAHKIIKAPLDGVPELEARLNDEVYTLFALSESQRTYIEEYFRRYGR